MLIKNNVLIKILSITSQYNYETGGILGGKYNVITEFVFDKGIQTDCRGCYYPDTDKLNQQILEWQMDNIEFYGIIHSHLCLEEGLSKGDINYIELIMNSLHGKAKYLYFPIVYIKNKTIIAYKAIISNRRLFITKEKILGI